MKNYLVIIFLFIIFDIKAQNYYDDPFNVGDLGPGGGVIFYEKNDWIDGWKYLEAADENWLNGVPTVSGFSGDYVQAFGTSSSTYNSTVNTLGYGDQNTYNTASYHNNRNNLMFNNVYGNVRGWFLPSLNEAYELYDYKLADNSVLNLENAVYYTSSTDPGNVNVAWTLNMSNRYHGYSGKGGGLRKRAVRKVKLNDVKNRDNKSLYFDSVTDGLMITDSDDFETSSLADRNYMFWINPKTSGFILSKYKHLDATNSDFYIRYQADTEQIQFTGNGTDAMLFGTVPLNQWSFIAITVVDGLVKGYVDGVLKASANLSFSDNTQQQQLYIGATPDIKNLDNTGWENNSFTGYLDDLSVWWQKTPPSPGFVESEILSYKLISPLGVERQLAGYWNFDEGFDNISTFGTVYNSKVGTSSPELSSIVSFDYAKAPTDLGFYTDDSTPLSQSITFNNSVGENYVVSELKATDLDTDNLTVTFDGNSGQTNNNSDFSISGSQLIMPNTTTLGTYNVDLITSDGQRQLRKRVIVNVIPTTVTGVSSRVKDDSYKQGDVIPITVEFSDLVNVTGIPQLTLETGSSDAVVNYSSGSGSSILTFNYTVASGHSSADLDYVATSSLALNSGTIKNASLNVATLTLASPGATNSLGANKAIVVDGTIPTVTGVTSTTSNGSYKQGDVIAITVGFSEVVNVTGTPQLTLETGSSDALVDYSSGSGSNTLTFNYTIGAGEISSDLDYTGTSSLALNSGTIKDAALNTATLTLASPGATNSLGANKAIVVDGTIPTVTGVTSTTSDGSYKQGDVIAITVGFSEVVNVTGTPQLTLETGSSDAVVDYSSGSGSNTLTFNYTIGAGEISSDLDYTGTSSLALNNGTIKDAALNAATLTLASPGATNSLAASRTLLIDTTLPTIVITATIGENVITNGSTINDTNIVITFTTSESTTDFTAEDVTVSGGTLSDFSTDASFSLYSANFTSTAEGAKTIDVNQSVFTDAAGNGNRVADQFSWISEISQPTASLAIDATNISEQLSATLTATLNNVSTSNTFINLAVSGTAVINQDYESTLYLTNKLSIVAGGNGVGNNTNQLSGPQQVAVDSKGDFYVVQEDNTIRKWSYGKSYGQIIDSFDESSPMTNIKIDDSNNIFILHLNGIVKKYNSNFSLLNTYQAPATGSQYYAFDIASNDESAYVLDFNIDAILYKTTVASSTAIMNTSAHFAEGLVIYDDQNIFVVGNNMNLSRYNISTKETNSYFDYQNCRDIILNSEKKLVVTSDVGLSSSGSPGLLREIVIDESFSIKKEITLLTKQDFYNSKNIAVNESELTNSGYEEIGISGIAQDIAGNYHLSLSKSSWRFGTNFDKTYEDRVIKYQISPMIEISAGELRGSIVFKGIEDELYSEGTETIILTPSAINATLTSTDPITINLTDIGGGSITTNQAPAITTATYSLAENSPNGIVLGTIEASDPDGDTLTYTIVSGNDAEAFGLGRGTGVLSVAKSAVLDYETITTFSLLVRVSDGALSDSATFTINLTDVDEDSITTNQAPSITAATYSLAENSPNGIVLGTIEASDPDGDTLTYTIVSGNDAEAFGLGRGTGVLSVAKSAVLDYETITTFSLLVRLSDGALSDSATFIINLTDVDEDSITTNQAPSITAATYSLAENSPNGIVLGTIEASDPDGDTLTYAIVSGDDAEAFSLDSEIGELTVSTSSALDFETTPSYSLGIEVSDGALIDLAIFTINLTDVDEEEEILSLADASAMIYPNPSDGIINIKMNQFKEATIYNLSGKRIMRSTDDRIDVSSFSEGVYIIKLENRSDDRFSTRLIKE